MIILVAVRLQKNITKTLLEPGDIRLHKPLKKHNQGYLVSEHPIIVRLTAYTPRCYRCCPTTEDDGFGNDTKTHAAANSFIKGFSNQ